MGKNSVTSGGNTPMNIALLVSSDQFPNLSACVKAFRGEYVLYGRGRAIAEDEGLDIVTIRPDKGAIIDYLEELSAGHTKGILRRFTDAGVVVQIGSNNYLVQIGKEE